MNTGSYTRQGSTATANINSNASGSGTKTEAEKSWVYVPNIGRQTWQELEQKIDRGEVKEIVDPVTGQRRYQKVK